MLSIWKQNEDITPGSGQVGELTQQDAWAEWNSKRAVTTTLISTYVKHLETKRRYRTRRRQRGGRVAARRRRDAMVDLALGSHPSHSGEKAHKVGVACKKSCSQNIAWPRRRPRPAKHLPPSIGGTVATVAAAAAKHHHTDIHHSLLCCGIAYYVPQSAICRPRLHCRRAAAFARAAIWQDFLVFIVLSVCASPKYLPTHWSGMFITE